jgi:hypothetical protein
LDPRIVEIQEGPACIADLGDTWIKKYGRWKVVYRAPSPLPSRWVSD